MRCGRGAFYSLPFKLSSACRPGAIAVQIVVPAPAQTKSAPSNAAFAMSVSTNATHAQPQAQKIINLYPSAVKVGLNSGHCPHDDTPAEANAALLNWLSGLPPVGGASATAARGTAGARSA